MKTFVRQVAPPALAQGEAILGEMVAPLVALNLCDGCAYEFGVCEGHPVMASEKDPTIGSINDRVIECATFVDVKFMPTVDELKKAAARGEAIIKAEEHIAERAEAAVNTAPDAERLAAVKARANIQRFKRNEDWGKCPACDRPLKRTAFNRTSDAIRCVNPRCRQYRQTVKQVKAE